MPGHESYQVQYLDPIPVQGGEIVTVSGKVDYWNDNPERAWVWCTDQQGRSGWVPVDHAMKS
ncbi:MAG TPA: hypothetical protein VKV40_09555 [Ktedonobacteraceae bacterium]|nr:hypothetical protein [Ktedonobacteraceae bacterium]